MADDNQKTEQPKKRSPETQKTEVPARPVAGQAGAEARPNNPQQGQGGQQPAKPQNKAPGQDAARAEAARQPKTPAVAKPVGTAKPGATPPDGARSPAGRTPGSDQRNPGDQGDEVYNQRVFDPTAEDTVTPRSRPMNTGRPTGASQQGGRPSGGGQNYGAPRGPAQGSRPGGGGSGGGYDQRRGPSGPGQGGPNQGPSGPGGGQGGSYQGRSGGNMGGSTGGGFDQRRGPGNSGGGNRGPSQQRRPQGKPQRQRQQEGSLTPPPKTTVATPARGAPAPVTEIVIGDMITVRDLADKMRRSPIEIIKTLMNYGTMVPITASIDFDTAALIGEELGVEVKPEKQPEPVVVEAEEEAPRTLRQKIMAAEKTENLVVRPPVVVVMGHVDHGKTTLLDAIRETRVVEGEAGGITQHIGAYQVELDGRKITFLDTPGHEAFTAMRARGAQMTDIAVLVVAADDGVMPQTKEAIAHAKAAQVPIVVALNKIDKAQSNPDRVKQELADNDVLIEEYGGDVMCVPVSAKMRRGISDLLENILLAVDIDPLMANPSGDCVGTVVESRLDKTRGPVATLLVQNGTLRQGDSIVTGETYAKIRAMYDDKGQPISEAPPSTPVQVLGFSEVPVAGETFEVVADERTARGMASEKQLQRRAAAVPAPARSLENIFAAAAAGQVKELNLILKADVQGSIEPIVNSLEKLGDEKLKVKLIHQGTGNITESDVMLAIASGATILGFSVSVDGSAAREAENEGVDIRLYNIIYNLIEDVQKALTGLLEPVFREVITGHAEIRQVFKVSKVGKVAGSYILDGEIQRNQPARIKRGGAVLAEDKVAGLKRFTEDVSEVKQGFECGINFHNFNEFEVGDVIEVYKKERVS